MPPTRDAATQAALDTLLVSNGLTADTVLYRHAERDALEDSDQPGRCRLAANPLPMETVVDVYRAGHVVPAEQVGAGLAFAEQPARDWQHTMEMQAAWAGGMEGLDRVGVKVTVAELLAQGGLLYPVESVAVEKAWYCTLPGGWVDVRELGA